MGVSRVWRNPHSALSVTNGLELRPSSAIEKRRPSGCFACSGYGGSDEFEESSRERNGSVAQIGGCGGIVPKHSEHIGCLKRGA